MRWIRMGFMTLMVMVLLDGCEEIGDKYISVESEHVWEREESALIEERAEITEVDEQRDEAPEVTQTDTIASTQPENPTEGQPENFETLSSGESQEPVSDYSYFEDALFIGDSRTAGLREYGFLDMADYFASPGMSIYSIPKTKVTVGEYTDIKLGELLEKKNYGKIYLMLGMNELGYDFEQTVKRYRELVEDLQVTEPDAVLYLCANLHVTITRSENDKIHNNANIDKMNDEIRKLAEEKELYYLDINELFDDEEGNLDAEYTSDDSHVLGKYYERWCEWLCEKIPIY